MTPLASAITIIAAALLSAAVLARAFRPKVVYPKIKCAECGKVFPWKGHVTINMADFCPEHGRAYQEVLHIGPFERRYRRDTERIGK